MFPDTLPVLTTERLLLRAMTEDDREAIYAIFSDREVMRYWSGPAMTDIAEVSAMLTRLQDGFAHRRLLRWGIVRKADHQLIGTCTLFDLSEQNRRAELGYVLGREFWGHGYMHEALTALVEYAFSELGLHRLEADIDPRNTASIRTVVRLGFVQEGMLRERWIVDGEISDSLMMGLLNREWKVGRNGKTNTGIE